MPPLYPARAVCCWFAESWAARGAKVIHRARNVWARAELSRRALEGAVVTESHAGEQNSPFPQDEGTSPNGKTLVAFQSTIGIKMAGHQDARYIPPLRKGDRSSRRWRNSFAVRCLAPAAIIIVAAALAAFTLIYWRGQTDYSDEQRACITQRYSQFDARKLSQCVDVCKACMKGSTATCNTSCWLKGAS
jgi:hypothetical protein